MACSCKITDSTYLGTLKNIARWAAGWGVDGFKMLEMAIDVMHGMIDTHSYEARQIMFSGMTKFIQNRLDCDGDRRSAEDPYFIKWIHDQINGFREQLVAGKVQIDTFPESRATPDYRPRIMIVISPDDFDLYSPDAARTREEQVMDNLAALKPMLAKQFQVFSEQFESGLLRMGEKEVRLYIPSCLMDNAKLMPDQNVTPFKLLTETFEHYANKFRFEFDLRFTGANQSAVAPHCVKIRFDESNGAKTLLKE